MQKLGHYCAFKTLERIQLRAWRGKRRILGCGWNAIGAAGWRWRFLDCLIYDWRIKWILVESIAQPSPTDILLSRLDRITNRERGGLYVTYGPDCYRKAMRVSPLLFETS